MPESRRDRRLAAALALLAAILLLSSALRVWLLLEQHGPFAGVGWWAGLHALWTGARLDAVIAGALTLPAALFLLLPGRGGAWATRAWSASVLTATALALCADLGFFRYYGFRANYLVIEHAGDPEVLRAIAGSYATPGWALALAAAVTAALALRARLEASFERCLGARAVVQPRLAALPLALGCALLVRGTLDHRPLNPSAAAISADRLLNEITASGALNVAYEFSQRQRGKRVPLAALHPLLPRAEAHARTRRLLGAIPAAEPGPGGPVRVAAATSPDARPTSVVVVVMESFTGRLVGALGGEPALSPEFDALAREGLLLANCYATGERTVQGLEAVLASFPPLLGTSVIRRAEAQTGFPTLASILAGRGYDTLFLYGGQGIFDQMRSFFLGNGFRTFVEEKDFEAPAFRGSWGVSDEDLFRRANREFQARWEQGRPFLGAILTVSLHAPWEFPHGRAPELPPGTAVPEGFERAELENFLYADFAIGEFMREARSLDYARDTLFVFVGDHGVHLRGRELLPSEEYRVPALFLAPGRLAPQRIASVTSQVDLAPTILGLLDAGHARAFFGRDVRASAAGDGLAILVYGKRHYGVRRADRLTVLLAGGAREAYRVSAPGALEPALLAPENDADARDALALLQVAEENLDLRREIHRRLLAAGEHPPAGRASGPGTALR